MYDPHAIKIYIDGSAYGNPGHSGGIGGIIEYPESVQRENEIIIEETYLVTTNNRMELRACLRAFQYIADNTNQFRLWGLTRVIIVTDSVYVNSNKNRASLWKGNGWRNGQGRPVENEDLWKDFLSRRSKLKVTTEIFWQKGKTDEIVKEVDRIAKRAAKKTTGRKDVGYVVGKVSKAAQRGASELFKAKGQKETVRIYRYRLLSGSDNIRVYFEVYSMEEKCFTGKFYAYSDKSKNDSVHRHGWSEVSFNSNPEYPIIEEITAIENPIQDED